MILRTPWFPGWSSDTKATTLTPWLIVLRRGLAGDELLDALTHERVHQAQMRRDGWLRFLRNYLGDGYLRAHYELEAFATNVVADWHRSTQPIEWWIHKYASDYPSEYSGAPGVAICEQWLTGYVEALQHQPAAAS